MAKADYIINPTGVDADPLTTYDVRVAGGTMLGTFATHAEADAAITRHASKLKKRRAARAAERVGISNRLSASAAGGHDDSNDARARTALDLLRAARAR